MKFSIAIFSVVLPFIALAELPVGVEADDMQAADTALPVTILNQGTNVTVEFASQLGDGVFPVSGEAVVGAALSTQQDAFTGDYTKSLAKGLCIYLGSDSLVKPNIAIVLTSPGYKWTYSNVRLGSVAAPARNNISLDFAAGWNRDGRNNTEAYWLESLEHVLSVEIRVNQNGLDPQSCQVSGLKLLLEDQVATPDAVLEERVVEWFGSLESGITSREEVLEDPILRSIDSDGDGISDLLEIEMTQTDPELIDESFELRFTQNPDGTLNLSWNVIAGGKYQIFRSGTPGRGYQRVGGPITADAVGIHSEDVDSEGDRQYFYSVKMVGLDK